MVKQPHEGIKELEVLREKLEIFVNFVLSHRKWIILGAVILVGVGAVLYGYSRTKTKKEEKAALLLLKALNAQEVDERIVLLDALLKDYSGGPSSLLARYFRARELMEKGEMKQAEQDLKVIAKKGPKGLKAQAFCLLGDVTVAQGKKEESLNYYQLCAEEGRGWLEAYALIKKAMLLDQIGKKKEAIEAYQKALPLLPQGEVELFVRLRLKELGT